MRSWLMITTVDVLARPNNREHQLLRHLAARFERTTVVFRRRCARGSFGQRLRDALVPSVEVTDRDGIRYVAVNPLLNHYEGMVRDAIGVGEKPVSPLRRNISRMIRVVAGPVGILKDIATIASLASAAARYNLGNTGTFCTALGPWAAAAARLLAGAGRIEAWLYEDRDYEPGFIDSAMRRHWATWMEVSCMRASRATITIGRRLAKLRRSRTGRIPFLIPTGADRVDLSTGGPQPRDPVLIYVGNVALWSGLASVIRALPAIRRNVPGARLLILGDGTPSVLRTLREIIAHESVDDAVDLVPGIPHSEVASRLINSSVGLAVFEPTPLRVFAMPLKVVEYMSAGLPVITTAETESADVVKHYNCGLSVDLTPDEIAGAAVRLLTDPSLWRALSSNGVTASADFEWTSLVEREWEVMQRAAESGRSIDAEDADDSWGTVARA